MNEVANTRRRWMTFALALVAVVLSAPIATAGTRDAVGRYLAAQQTGPDAVGRWLAVHRQVNAAPVSDVASSLDVARNRPTMSGPGQTPISDNASSQVSQTPNSASGRAVSPVSDNANSLAVTRSAAAADAGASTSTGFAWSDAGIGAGATLLFMLIAGGSLTFVRRHRRLAV